MQIEHRVVGGAIELAVAGRLDGSWADHLDSTLAEVVREGHHDVRLNLAGIVFLSSAGVGVLAKHYRQLTAIGGSLVVVEPSRAVERVLAVAQLADRLVVAGPPPGAETPDAAGPRRLPRKEAEFDVFDLDPSASLRAEVIDSAAGPPGSECDVSLGSRAPLLALGVGAFGSGFEDCRTRYGELLSVAGGTAYQPGDGTNAADYLVSPGPLAPDVRLLHGVLCEGCFAYLVRFQPADTGETVGLGALLSCCRHVASAPRAGVVIVAESSGLVGASLRRSPVAAGVEESFFAHPGVRSRLTFTAEPAFARTLVVAAGVVSTPEAAVGTRQLRPIAPDLVGHVHAAAFGFRPLRKGRIDLRETVFALFEGEPLLGILHLLTDDRGASGAGESRFIRGACWTGRIGAGWSG